MLDYVHDITIYRAIGSPVHGEYVVGGFRNIKYYIYTLLYISKFTVIKGFGNKM